MTGPLVSCEELAERLDDPTWHVFDCRTRLGDPGFPERAFGAGHIPGAVVAHMEDDLSDPVGDGLRGRHPLPSPHRFLGLLAAAGVRPGHVVVAYDDEGGWWASRLWWLCRHYGIRDAAVLDGGWKRWTSLALPEEQGERGMTRPGSEDVAAAPGAMPTVSADHLPDLLLDARVAPRYRGEVEPVDRVAGHIPGARNLPAASLVHEDMRLLDPSDLRARFEAAGAVDADAACYCGSGVTATFLVLAAEAAGLPTPALYPGSWSSWIAEGRPVETSPPAPPSPQGSAAL